MVWTVLMGSALVLAGVGNVGAAYEAVSVDAVLRFGTRAPQATQTTNSGTVNVTFGLQGGGPLPESVDVAAPVALPADGCIRVVSVRVRAQDDTPSQLWLYVDCAGGRRWKCPLTPPTPGEWQTYTVPLDYEAGWSIGPWKTRVLFESDRTQVVGVGLHVARSVGTAAQRVAATDFMVEGADWDAQDADDDGMCNGNEVAAGTRWDDGDSLLAVDLAVPADGGAGFEVAWDSVEGRRYTVWRAHDLQGVWVPLQTSVAAAPPRNRYLDLANAGAPRYFYKVSLEESAR